MSSKIISTMLCTISFLIVYVYIYIYINIYINLHDVKCNLDLPGKSDGFSVPIFSETWIY